MKPKIRQQRGLRMNRFTIIGFLITTFLSAQSVFAEISAGSGFFITEDGYFVTNFHVIEDAKEITLMAKNGKSLPADIVRIDKANDLAILKANGNFIPLPIANSRSAKRGQRVITVGYPHVDVQGFEAKVTDGIINSLSGIRDDPRVFQISVPVQSGNSGGPLVTQEGNVVGIVASKLSAVALLKETGDLPQNVNYAVKSNYLLEVLASISGLEGKLAPQNQKKFKETDDLISIVEKSIALVLAKAAPEGSLSQHSIRKDSTPNKVQGPSSFSIDEVMTRIARGDVKTDYSMSVVAPETAENGAVVPFFINLSTPIGAGDRIIVVVNDKYPAYIAVPLKSTYISHLTGRVKMPSGSGTIRAVVVNSKGELKSATKNVNVTVGVQSFDNGENAHSSPTFIQRSFDLNGMIEIKLLINYPSSSTNFIDSVTTEFSDGAVAISLTPVASKNPFVGFKASRPENPGYWVTVKDNRGRTSTSEGHAY